MIRTACVTEEQIGRVDRVVMGLTKLSNRVGRALFDHQCITVNGSECTDAGLRVNVGDTVEVRFDPARGYREKKKSLTDRTYSILFEDAHLIVVNKAAHVLTVATEHGERNTLVSRVSEYLRHTGRQREALVVHRLDRGVSGVLVLAKSTAIHRSLKEQFKERKPDRKYVAIVAGVVQPETGTIRSYLETGENLDQFSTRDPSKGQYAVTHYVVQKTLRDMTVVEVQLETGRRNQIRVHFADMGHPVLGDPRYGGKGSRHRRWVVDRMALHAVSLGLVHPATLESMTFDAEIPVCMRQIMGTL